MGLASEPRDSLSHARHATQKAGLPDNGAVSVRSCRDPGIHREPGRGARACVFVFDQPDESFDGWIGRERQRHRRFSVLPNADKKRDGTITIAGRMLTVSQSNK